MTRQRLWAPWRVGYISRAGNSLRGGCIFCRIRRSKKGDTRNQVVVRGRLSLCVLNRFPYNNGHLLIAPYRHVGRLESLTQAEWLEILDLANDSIARLHLVMRPHGYNLGINLGKGAGAGIPGHLHLHIVPRWVGDTNFMPILANAKVISQSLAQAHRLLKRASKKVAKGHRR